MALTGVRRAAAAAICILALPACAGRAPAYVTPSDTSINYAVNEAVRRDRTIRVGTAEKVLSGRARSALADTLQIGEQKIAFEDIRSMDIYAGRRSGARTGAIIGAVPGALFTAFLAAVDATTGLTNDDDTFLIALYGGTVTAAGAAVGALIGAVVHPAQTAWIPAWPVR